MSISIEAAAEFNRQMAELHGVQAKSNPAGSTEERRSRRIPMSIPRQRLAVPEIPGYWQYWFKQENVARAIDAGYEFVDPAEVNIAPTNVGLDNDVSGNTDMGSRVSMITGILVNGEPMRAYLMKLRMDWHLEDEAAKLKLTNRIMEAIFGEEANEMFDEKGGIRRRDQLAYTENPYGRGGPKPLMNKPTRKAVIGRRGR